MEPDRIDRLTEQQRLCLRFVYAHLTSKQIAPHLGIEPHSVDQHIKTAVRVLGAADRRAAARILAQHERHGASQPLVYQTLDIAIAPEPAMFATSTAGDWRRADRILDDAMAGRKAAMERAPSDWRPLLPLPIGGAGPDDVGWLRRLAWIAAITFGAAIAFGALVSGLEALTRLSGG